MSTATVTTQRLRPRFSTFLVLFTGKNSRPSSKPFTLWTEKGSAAQNSPSPQQAPKPST